MRDRLRSPASMASQLQSHASEQRRNEKDGPIQDQKRKTQAAAANVCKREEATFYGRQPAFDGAAVPALFRYHQPDAHPGIEQAGASSLDRDFRAHPLKI